MDKTLLTSQKVELYVYAIPDLGEVTLRALTRFEALEFVNKKIDESEMERKLLATALVDPELTEAEALEWQKVAPAGQIQPIVEKIMELSGLRVDSGKSAYKSTSE